MATYDSYSNIKFSTTAIEEDILLNSDIKASIMRKRAITTDEQYTDLLTKGIPDMDFMIFASDTRISANDIDYSEGELLNNKIYVSGDYLRKSIKSIKSEAIITDAIFSYNLL